MTTSTTNTVQILAAEIPQERIEIMARSVLAAVRAAFEDPATKAEYAKWLAERRAKKGAKA